jgi:GH24 family phage-related lysozyme (muramidase)
MSLTPNDYFPYATLLEGYKPSLYVDTAGKMTIGIGFNVSAPGAVAILEQMGVADSLQADIAAAQLWINNPDPNKGSFPGGTYQLSDFIIQALYQESATPAIAAAYASFANPDDLSADRMMVVIDMNYNLGSGGFQNFVGLISALNTKDFDLAAFEMMSHVGSSPDTNQLVLSHTPWYQGTGNRGLLDVQVMRGARLPTNLPAKPLLVAIGIDNDKFAQQTLNLIENWERVAQTLPASTPLPPRAPSDYPILLPPSARPTPGPAPPPQNAPPHQQPDPEPPQQQPDPEPPQQQPDPEPPQQQPDP